MVNFNAKGILLSFVRKYLDSVIGTDGVRVAMNGGVPEIDASKIKDDQTLGGVPSGVFNYPLTIDDLAPIKDEYNIGNLRTRVDRHDLLVTGRSYTFAFATSSPDHKFTFLFINFSEKGFYMASKYAIIT